MDTKSTTNRMSCRRGATLTELVVAAVVMVMVMSLVTTLCYRISLVWQDIGHHRVAIAELSNQLDQLTRMTPEQAREALDSIAPSELSQRTLRNPELKGSISPSEIGHRIQLELNWNRRHPGQPVGLTGWIPLRPEQKEPEQ